MRSLEELDGQIISLAGRPNRGDCVVFDCPVCTDPHKIMVSWLGPSLFQNGQVWQLVAGSSVRDLDLSPSINCDVPYKHEDGTVTPSRCKFHGWIKNGSVTW